MPLKGFRLKHFPYFLLFQQKNFLLQARFLLQNRDGETFFSFFAKPAGIIRIARFFGFFSLLYDILKFPLFGFDNLCFIGIRFVRNCFRPLFRKNVLARGSYSPGIPPFRVSGTRTFSRGSKRGSSVKFRSKSSSAAAGS